MVFVSSAIHAHSSHTGKDKMTPVNVGGSFVPLMYIGYFDCIMLRFYSLCLLQFQCPFV